MSKIFERSWIGDCFIDKVSKSSLLSAVDEWIRSGSKNNYIIPLNMGKLAMMQKDKKLSECITNSNINIADGFSMFIATRLIGNPVPERITGIELMIDMLKLADEHKYNVFFLGSKPEILELFVDKCKVKYPNINVVGERDGYFNDSEKNAVVCEISASNADILFIALGMPQKEYFIYEYSNKLNTSVILPVGGGFDVFVGVKKRAPRIVQICGSEWVWRSLYDKSRMTLVVKSFFSFITILSSEIFRQRILGIRRR
jgi:N-acetylglucosaminyldiphosphoundecaprenol N-acetyl-beta-D-mannosaminyltransferase